MTKGKFIVLYGINNIGKTTQAEKLVERIKAQGLPCEHLKYPLYKLEPTGTMINEYLRQGNPSQLNPREIQILYCMNRYQFQEELIKKMEQGINIVAEDYTGTGIAWGVGRGVDKEFLIRINEYLLKPDLEILLDGERFLEGKEKYHINENDDELVNQVRKIHLDLQAKYHWPIVEANHDREEVGENIWQLVKNLF